jgi:hypothetical protein
MRYWCLALLLVWPARLAAQDAVTFRDRSVKGERPIQTIKADIESESLAGIKISGRLIPSVDVIDVQYVTPGFIRLDLPNAISAETAHKYDDAIREYRGMLARPEVSKSAGLQRHFEYKIATLTAAKADGPGDDARAGIAALQKFTKDYPDCWQRVAATRAIARLSYEFNPPNFEQSRKAYEELMAASGATPEIKSECGFAIVDSLMRSRQVDAAQKQLSAVPKGDPRIEYYRIVCNSKPDDPSEAIAKLEEAQGKAEEMQKATVYNLLGDCQRLDPKRRKDALFSYLWVDVVYNQDPVEVAKAQSRLAELFLELKDENRAKIYRDKLRGR